MTCLPIVEYPDSRLRQSAAPVTRFDEETQCCVENLFDTLYASGGIGLCAPQIGCMSRILVADLSDDRSAGQIYINPEVLTRSTPGIIEESCLSVPGIVGKVLRHTHITVRAQTVTGEQFEQEASGMHAVCIQHEIDHLDGKLFVDRLWLLGRWRARAKLAELARGYSAATA